MNVRGDARRSVRPLGGLLATILAASAFAGDWQPAAGQVWPDPVSSIQYVERSLAHARDGRTLRAHLALFVSRDVRLEVIDLGNAPGLDPMRDPLPGSRPPTLAEALQAAGCVAGTNGSFFRPDGQPLGLTIAQGQRIGRFETSRLLGGVLYSDDRGIHLVRRADFQEHPHIRALLQTGPYLVEDGRAVRGLSAAASDRRTFIATDWRGHWALGVTATPLTLADLASALTLPGALTPWPVDRAINLDGGTSTGFFFDLGPGRTPAIRSPWKGVRNLLCVRPRR